jgi:hypothetical protein
MLDLFGHATATTASTAPAEKPDFAKIKGAIQAMNDLIELESAPLRKLFADHGYDLANGDVLYHSPDVVIDVPPRYRAQVVEHKLLEARCLCFTRNPKFSLF